MLEYEKKIMLTEAEYNAIIIILCKCASVVTQTNYYFDTDDLSMSKMGITCRIREKDGIFKATIKSHDTKHPDCSVEEDLVEKTEFDPNIFNTLGLRYHGELVTDRIVMHKDSYCEIVVDRNTYLGATDFELEIEYCKESECRAQAHLERIAEGLVAAKLLIDPNEFMERVGQGKTKSQRFFEKRMQNIGA